jgi:hypothetical protein
MVRCWAECYKPQVAIDVKERAGSGGVSGAAVGPSGPAFVRTACLVGGGAGERATAEDGGVADADPLAELMDNGG